MPFWAPLLTNFTTIGAQNRLGRAYSLVTTVRPSLTGRM
jgi:hypothetical protein